MQHDQLLLGFPKVHSTLAPTDRPNRTHLWRGGVCEAVPLPVVPL